MTTTSKWTTPESIQTYLSTELNSLANSTSESTGKKLGGIIDNETDLYELIDIDVYIASITTGSGSPYIGIWLLAALDGSTYDTGDDSAVDPPTAQYLIFPLKASYTGAQLVTLFNVPIPPLKLKGLYQSKAGAALASSGNYVKYRRHTEQGV